MQEFLVARNADAQSTLPYLLYLPIDGGMWLKAKETWPRSARVYCHPAEPPRMEELDILERVPVRSCVRRGVAIDLILDRANNKRAQFVFTVFRGRSMVFWQTPRVATSARPGVRIPHSTAGGSDVICVDTRERYGYKFAAHPVQVLRRALPVGDYAAERDGALIASVERKTLDDFVKSLVDGSLNYVMSELALLRCAAIVVEGTYSAVLRHQYTRAGFLADLIARVQVRYPSVPIVFAESRKIAEEWTFRFLRAARSGGMELLPASALVVTPPESRKTRAKRKK